MSLWMERFNEMDHYYTLLHEAEQNRLIRQAREEGQRNQEFWRKGLNWSGFRLSTWRNHLQERYGFTTQVITWVRAFRLKIKIY